MNEKQTPLFNTLNMTNEQHHYPDTGLDWAHSQLLYVWELMELKSVLLLPNSQDAAAAHGVTRCDTSVKTTTPLWSQRERERDSDREMEHRETENPL